MKVGICAIIKDCKPSYLNEWLEWHRLIGVDCFFIYDNDSKIPIKNIIQDLKNISIIPIHGEMQQSIAYTDCIKKQQQVKDCDWIAFIDDDEFLVFDCGNIKTFLQNQKNSGVCLNWILFGASKSGSENQSQIAKYTRCLPVTAKVNLHVKSIVNVQKTESFNHPHIAKYKEGFAVDVFGNEVNTPFVENAVHSIAWINHYYCRSLEEFREKNKRGRADLSKEMMPNSYPDTTFTIYDSQATENTTKIQQILAKLKCRV